MGRQKIRQLTLTTWSVMIIVILCVVLLLSWMSYRFLRPFPPKTLTMATGLEGGSYAVYGELYRQALARSGIRIILRPTSGAVENERLLRDRSRPVSAGFVQGKPEGFESSSNIVSLGGLAYTPLWIFYKSRDTLDDLSQLRGKRIAIGPEGSGVRKFALELLKAAHVDGPPTRFLDLSYAKASQALLENKIDAMMH